MPNENVEQKLLLQLKSLPQPFTHRNLIDYVCRQLGVPEDVARLALDNSMIYSVRSDMVLCLGTVHDYLKKHKQHNNDDDDDEEDEEEHKGDCSEAKIELLKMQSDSFNTEA